MYSRVYLRVYLGIYLRDAHIPPYIHPGYTSGMPIYPLIHQGYTSGMPIYHPIHPGYTPGGCPYTTLYTPWVYHHPAPCWSPYCTPGVPAEVYGERALGSERRISLGREALGSLKS